MLVELLFWSGCPSHPRALADLREALTDVGLDPDDVIVREIHSEGEAELERFVGSPTIRFDGIDVRPPAAEEPFALACRVYRRRDGRVSPTPDPADLRDALRAAAPAAATAASATAASGTSAASSARASTTSDHVLDSE